MNECIKVKSPSFNPFPFLIIIILILSFCLFAEKVSAESSYYCSDEEIKNFEEMGLDDGFSFYIKTDTIQGVSSWYDNPIYFDDDNWSFSMEENYMTLYSFGEDGRGYINGYAQELNMYDYENACILKINDNIPLKGKSDYYLSSNGIIIDNDYKHYCERDNVLFSIPCFLIILFNSILSFLLVNNSYFLIIFSSLVVGLAVVLFVKIRGCL